MPEFPRSFARLFHAALLSLAGGLVLMAAPQERRPIRILGGDSPAPRGGDEVRSLLDQVALGSPVTPPRMEHVLVYPLIPSRGRPSRGFFTDPGYLTLDQALSRKLLLVRERSTPTVPALDLENTSDTPVLILAGEILVGGKQNRILQSDLLLPPHSGRRDVTAYCVEHGRWTSGSSSFRAAGALAPAPVRQSAALKQDQDEIWRRIDDLKARTPTAAASPTQSLHEIMEDKKVLAEVAPKVEGLRSGLPGDAVGMIAVANGSIYSFDLFSSVTLFERYRDKILRAAVMGAPGAIDYLKAPSPDVRWFLSAAREAESAYFGSPGLGSRIEVSGSGVRGEALAVEGRVVHMALFLW